MAARFKRPSSRFWFPTLLGLALVSFLLELSDLGALFRALILPFVLIVELVALTLVYLFAKWIVWFRLVRRAGIDAAWQDVWFSYLGGELTKSLPGGIYFQNYLLKKLSGHRVAVGIATSSVLVALEAFVTMAIVLILGIRGWPWIRPALTLISLVWIVLLLGLWKSGLIGRLEPWAAVRHPKLHVLLQQATFFYEGLQRVWHPRLWLEIVLWTALYILVAAVQLYLIAQFIGLSGLTFAGACAAYAFSMILPLMIPIPVQIGFSEATGTGALVAMGIARGEAIALMFAFRLWNNGLVFPIDIPLMLMMRRQWRRTLAPGKQDPGDGLA